MEKQDLTKGNVTKTLIKYALPMITTSLFQSVYSIVDIIVAGRFIGGNGISAINNASLIMNLMTQIAIGLTMGGNVLISQYFGARNVEAQKKSVGTIFVLSIGFGVISGVIFFNLAEILLRLLGAPSLEFAVVYLKICAIGMPFIFGYNALSAILRALGNSQITMEIIIISSCCNVVCDILFVALFSFGIAGTAVGTLISQVLSFILALTYVIRHREAYSFEKKYIKIDREKAGLIIKLGFPIALQWTVASISWLAVAFLINRYGINVSAGNGISNKIKDFCQLFISAMASAGATMAAQNLGAKEYERGRKVMIDCMKINLLIATILIILAEIFAPVLVSIFSTDAAVSEVAVVNLRIEIIAQWFYAGFLTFNVLATGAGDTMFVLANSFLNCIVVRLVLAFILEHFMGVMGVYIACMVAPLSSVPVGYWYYKSNKWKKSIGAEKKKTERRQCSV